MAALGELLIYIIYFTLGLLCLFLLFLTIRSKKTIKIWTFIGSLFFGILFFNFKSCQDNNYKKNQLSVVGTYYLTNYPNCASCIIQLNEDMTYYVVSNGNIIEKSNWHYEVGGDYLITYLDNDKHQLGANEYAFKGCKLKYKKNDKK